MVRSVPEHEHDAGRDEVPKDSPGRPSESSGAARPGSPLQSDVLALQRMAGNRAVGRWLAEGGGRPAVMRDPVGTAPLKPADPSIPTGGTTVDRVGIVGWDGKPPLRLRSSPDTSTDTNVLGSLVFNTRLQVVKSFPGNWYFVSTTDGRLGYVASNYVRTDLPEPMATLHPVESGRHGYAISIAEHYYGDKADHWGRDLRFYVNVLAWANDVKTPDTYDGWKEVHFQPGHKIWIPSYPFARSLVGKINSGSLSYEILDELGVAGFLRRLGDLIEDFQTAINKSGKYMADAIARHVTQALIDVVISLVTMMVAAIAIVAIFTALGGAIGFVFGGPGGAALGGSIGFELSLLFLEWLGIAFLIKWLADAVQSVASAFVKFLVAVWDAHGDEKKLDDAGYDFAEAIGTLLGTLVEAVAAWIAAKGLEIGIAKIKETPFGQRMGQKYFDWLKDRTGNEERLKREQEEKRRRDEENKRREEEEKAKREREEAEKREHERKLKHEAEEKAKREHEERRRREQEEERAREAAKRKQDEVDKHAVDEASKREHEDEGKDRTTEPAKPPAEVWRVCFLAGTLVATEAGPVPIERIVVGTRVLARSASGNNGYYSVEATQTGFTRTIWRISVAGGEVSATRHHPFMVSDQGWKPASELTVGDMLVSSDAEPVEVLAVTSADASDMVGTCNLTVSGAASYYVYIGERAVLVHNAKPKTQPLPPNERLYWSFGKPRGRAEGPKIDTDGISMWQTDNMDEVKEMMNIRASARGTDDELFYHTEAQLNDAKVAYPETPGDPADPMTKAGFTHRSARPATSPDASVELNAGEIKATEVALRGAAGKKLTPKQMKASLAEAKLEC